MTPDDEKRLREASKMLGATTLNLIRQILVKHDSAVLEASREAILEEREKCARIAEQWDCQHPETNYGTCIARVIRGRQK